jgi:hypothetical protein
MMVGEIQISDIGPDDQANTWNGRSYWPTWGEKPWVGKTYAPSTNAAVYIVGFVFSVCCSVCTLADVRLELQCLETYSVEGNGGESSRGGTWISVCDSLASYRSAWVALIKNGRTRADGRWRGDWLKALRNETNSKLDNLDRWHRYLVGGLLTGHIGDVEGLHVERIHLVGCSYIVIIDSYAWYLHAIPSKFSCATFQKTFKILLILWHCFQLMGT